MTSAADDIPDLERLMRDVLRSLLAAESGPDWLESLSSKVRPVVAAAAARAQKNRPMEVLRDDWDAVGIGEIGAALQSGWQTIGSALEGIWSGPNEASVDFTRLKAYRDKNLHAVGPPDAQVTDDEIRAMILRLRLGFEALRRRLANDNDEWWPYIETIHSNVPEFCISGSGVGVVVSAVVTVGDLLEFAVVGINPMGSQDHLRYRCTVLSGTDSGWVETRTFEVTIPLKRTVVVVVSVAQIGDEENAATQNFVCNVRPVLR